MTLHVFNPEHDLALASGLSNFTAPHAGRRLRADLGYLPALWAGEDDCVLVEHVEQARRAYGRLRARVGGSPCCFVDKSQLSSLPIDRVEPWGWDLALRAALIRYGVPAGACPSESEIADVREYSHRRYAAEVLHRLISLLTPHSSSSKSPSKPLPSRRWSNVCPILLAWWSRHHGAVAVEGCVSLTVNSLTTIVAGSVTSSPNRVP